MIYNFCRERSCFLRLQNSGSKKAKKDKNKYFAEDPNNFALPRLHFIRVIMYLLYTHLVFSRVIIQILCDKDLSQIAGYYINLKKGD
jgi:hypothetical protein